MGTTLNVFGYAHSWAEIRTYHLPDNERMRYVLHHSRGIYDTIAAVIPHLLHIPPPGPLPLALPLFPLK